MKKIIIILLFMNVFLLQSQNEIDTIYKVNIVFSAFPTINFFSENRAPDIGDKRSTGYGFLVRSMWHPGRSLAIGLMTGYIQLAYDEISASDNSKAELYAVPTQIALALKFTDFEIGIGLGPYLLFSKINYINEANSHRLELGVTFFSSYSIPLTSSISLGIEARVLYLSFRGVISIMPSLNLKYNIFEY